MDIRGLTILLSDDNWIVGHRLHAALDQLGALVSAPVPTVGEARALLKNVAFDVAIVELNLGGQKAGPLIDDLLDRNIPVVVLSGGEVPLSIARKVFAVLPKPCRLDGLLAVLGTIKPQEFPT